MNREEMHRNRAQADHNPPPHPKTGKGKRSALREIEALKDRQALEKLLKPGAELSPKTMNKVCTK